VRNNPQDALLLRACFEVSEVTGNPIRIPLVEDNPGDTRLLRESLTEVEADQFDMTRVSKHSAGLERFLRKLSENLLIQFSVASFVILAVIAVAIVTVLSNGIRSNALDVLADEAVADSARRILRAITPADLEVPMTGERYNRFDEFVNESILSDTTARIKLWAKDGTVIYSDAQVGVGEEFPTNENLQRALRGETAVKIKEPVSPENEHERDLGTLMEVYTPIIFPGTTEPQGALEIYQYYEHTANLINELRRWVLASIGVGFLVLYGALVSIVWRGWQTITRQRTDRNQAEVALRQNAEDLARSNAELQQFAYIASHDLQEPLRMVSSYTQLLGRRYKGKLDAEADEFIEYAVDGAQRMQSLINDLLAYSRVGTDVIALEPIDFNVPLNRAVSNLQATIRESQALVTHGPLPTVRADASQLTQVLQNLIGNAIKFHGEDPPRIHVSTQLEDHTWVFSVADNGLGIAPQYADRIFDVFQRLHTRDQYSGTGIGLAICKKVVERHGGQIWVESEPGKGATFYFRIPVGDDSQP